MDKLILVSVIMFLSTLKGFSQSSNYAYIEGIVKSPSSVIITLKTFATKKKDVDSSSRRPVIRPNTTGTGIINE